VLPSTVARAFSSQAPSNAKEAVEFVKKNNAEMVDFKFTDLYGTWHHLQVHRGEFGEGTFENGVSFDGSSIRGWQPINESDMLLIPVPSTAKIDPFVKVKTATFLCEIKDPFKNSAYGKDPRYVSRKAVEFLKSTGIAADCRMGPEAEFFLFNAVRYSTHSLNSFVEIQSDESINSSKDFHNNGYKIRKKEGYFPDKPWDRLQDVRNEMVQEMVNVGLHVEASHHEVAATGQCEIDIKFDTLTSAADNIQWYKYVVRNVAARNGFIATFMPKPLADDNGSGQHTHVSLHKADGTNLFIGNQYAGLSEMALYFIGGVIKHAQAIAAFSNPTINSYKRLVPGFEAPVNMAFSNRNRSAAIRIPHSPAKARRFEFRTPDTSSNSYLSFSAILMAGIDGIKHKINPGQPLEKDIYTLSPEELSGIPKAPGSLEEAINALEADHKFLTDGDVFTKDLIETWISRKREYEIDVARKLPTPWEFHQYVDC